MSLQYINMWLIAYLIFIIVESHLPTMHEEEKKWRAMVNLLIKLIVFAAINAVLVSFLLGREEEMTSVVAWWILVVGFASLTYLIWLIEIVVPRLQYLIRNR